jgi:hypothetical protein
MIVLTKAISVQSLQKWRPGGAAMLQRRALQHGVKCRNAEHCDRGLTNTEYPGFSRDWALDVQYWTLKQMRISNVEYRIANVQQPSIQIPGQKLSF